MGVLSSFHWCGSSHIEIPILFWRPDACVSLYLHYSYRTCDDVVVQMPFDKLSPFLSPFVFSWVVSQPLSYFRSDGLSCHAVTVAQIPIYPFFRNLIHKLKTLHEVIYINLVHLGIV